MSWRNILFGVFLTALSLPLSASACPSCADAVPDTSGAEAIDQERESRAYNHSIYLMVGMPYLLLGGMGLMIYRSHRRHAQDLAKRTALAGADNGGIGHALSTLPADPSENLASGGGDR